MFIKYVLVFQATNDSQCHENSMGIKKEHYRTKQHDFTKGSHTMTCSWPKGSSGMESMTLC